MAVVAVLLFAAPAGMVAFNTMRVAAACPCNILPANPVPQGTDTHGSGLEVGVKFRSSVDGYVVGVRFYKMTGMNGVHTGSLWDNMGSRLATATFSNETADGWQQVNFSTPVEVDADTVYTVSTFMANGVYAYTSGFYNTPTVSAPLTAPASGTPDAEDGLGNDGQGVTDLSGTSVYPTSSFGAANYWVDVAFTDVLNTDPPIVTATAPVDDATNVALGETVTATFDIGLNSSSLTTDTFGLKDDQNNPVAGSVSYNVSTKTGSFTPSSPLAVNKTYTATLEGGSGTVVRSQDGVSLAADYTWQFTTVAADPCPCTLKNGVNPAGSQTADEASGVELGVKLVPKESGYITAVRFYKPVISTETTRAVHIWSSTGASLATASSSNESEYGWQEVRLSSPVAVTDGEVYVVSYSASDGVYQASNGALNSNIDSSSLIAYASGDAQNAATGSGNGNGVFTSTVGAYPGSASGAAGYYWIDAVFSTDASATEELALLVTQPKANAYGVKRSDPITVTFARPLDAGTVSGSTVTVRNASNNQIAGSVAYSTSSRQISFTPSSSLSYGQKYTVTLSSSIAATDGVSLGTDYTWSFTVGTQLSSDINQGPGGPILVVTASGDKYGAYYAEILRTEGLNYFRMEDLSAVNASMLDSYDAVVLAEMSLTQSQADVFSTWVQGGGNLIAMRPDKKLASLFGLTDAGSTRTNQYLLVNTSGAPGAGIINETIQFKGTADNYTLNGASPVATFYSDATTSSPHPAVTSRSVGSSGGTAMAFMYDLAKSVIALHQGNQAWAGQERDGITARRSNDLFYGAKAGDVQPDWVDMNKFHIPQADEQQRLLANMITEATKDKQPLPRFWYLPGDAKAAMVLAGDDHDVPNSTGTERVINNWINESPTDCSAQDWECVRASHYVYNTAPLTDVRAAQYERLGYEIADHVSNNKLCNDYTSQANFSSIFGDDLSAWRSEYPSISDQVSNRTHCYLWSDWDSVPIVELAHGVRYDLNYVAYPGAWVNSRAPLMTGSGMNMRLTEADGDMIDVRQGVTNLDDTSANATSVNALLNNAVGSPGFYGIFGTHYDMTSSYDVTLYEAAASRGIPLISSAQALTWLDGHGSSTFSDFSGAAGQYLFTVSAAEGAYGLKAMMPINSAGGTLNNLKLAGTNVSYQTQAVKGVQYAVFDASPGNYTATYSDYQTPGPDPEPNPGDDDGAGTGTSDPENPGGGSSSSPSRSSRKTANLHDGNKSATPEATNENQLPDSSENSQTPAEDDGNNSGPDRSEEQSISDRNGGNWVPWVLTGVGTILLLGGIWWFVAARRRSVTPWQ